MPKSPESEVLAKCFADMGENRKSGENLAKHLADFRPSISRKIGRKKFLTKNSSANSTSHDIKVFHRETLGACAQRKPRKRRKGREGGGGVGWGPAKVPASQCACVCQKYPLAAFCAIPRDYLSDTPYCALSWRAYEVRCDTLDTKGVSQRYLRDTTWKQAKTVRYPSLRYHLKKALRDMEGISHWAAKVGLHARFDYFRITSGDKKIIFLTFLLQTN